MKKKIPIQLSQLVDLSSPSAILEEVKSNFIQYYPISEFFKVRQVFKDFRDFYDGKFYGYRACNTQFHDKSHITDALLAMSRLIDGYNSTHKKLQTHKVVIALLATILHDSGYIQKTHDNKGTGAKYTLNHVQRSMDFVINYFKDIGLSADDALSAGRMISCTGYDGEFEDVKFASKEEHILGNMLGTADLIGQMSARNYLEKLIFLYHEFKEGHVEGFRNETTMFEKTFKFYKDTKMRLKNTLGGVDKYAAIHFMKRYRIRLNMYHIAIDGQIKYLAKIMKSNKVAFKDNLKREIGPETK